MIQFNLLPDIKLEFIRMRRTKRMVMLIASAIGTTALTIFIVLLLSVSVFQKRHIANLTKDITKASSSLSTTEDLDKILTVQNQLNGLQAIHAEKPKATRLLEFVKEFTPADVRISSLSVDFTAQSVSITGDADSIAAINGYVDTLKFTDYNDEGTTGKAFAEVVLGGFQRSQTGAGYTIAFKYDPILFDNTKKVSINVPKNTVTTRSELEKPRLFKAIDGTDGAQ